MAATELLAVTDTAASSDDITVDTGTPVAVRLKTSDDAVPVPAGSEVMIELKDDDAQYWPVGKLNVGNPSAVLSIAGIYRLRRIPRPGVNVGAFRGA